MSLKSPRIRPVYIAPGLTVIFADMVARLDKIMEDIEDTGIAGVVEGVRSDLHDLCEGHDPAYLLSQLASDQVGYSDWRWMQKMDEIEGEMKRRIAEAERSAEERLQNEIERRFGTWQKVGRRELCL